MFKVAYQRKKIEALSLARFARGRTCAPKL